MSFSYKYHSHTILPTTGKSFRKSFRKIFHPSTRLFVCLSLPLLVSKNARRKAMKEWGARRRMAVFLCFYCGNTSTTLLPTFAQSIWLSQIVSAAAQYSSPMSNALPPGALSLVLQSLTVLSLSHGRRHHWARISLSYLGLGWIYSPRLFSVSSVTHNMNQNDQYACLYRISHMEGSYPLDRIPCPKEADWAISILGLSDLPSLAKMLCTIVTGNNWIISLVNFSKSYYKYEDFTLFAHFIQRKSATRFTIRFSK